MRRGLRIIAEQDGEYLAVSRATGGFEVWWANAVSFDSFGVFSDFLTALNIAKAEALRRHWPVKHSIPAFVSKRQTSD